MNFTQSFDAVDWAKDFIEQVEKNPEIATDKSAMIGWFANALMRGFDEASARHVPPFIVTYEPKGDQKEKAKKFAELIEKSRQVERSQVIGHAIEDSTPVTMPDGTVEHRVRVQLNTPIYGEEIRYGFTTVTEKVKPDSPRTFDEGPVEMTPELYERLGSRLKADGQKTFVYKLPPETPEMAKSREWMMSKVAECAKIERETGMKPTLVVRDKDGNYFSPMDGLGDGVVSDKTFMVIGRPEQYGPCFVKDGLCHHRKETEEAIRCCCGEIAEQGFSVIGNKVILDSDEPETVIRD